MAELSGTLPTGTITFLFTDIEGSTKLWERCPDSMRVALGDHDAIFRATTQQYRGSVFKTVGDAFCCAFADPRDAVACAVAAQQALRTHAWPGEVGELRVRMGIHTGTAVERDGDYFGPTVNRVARLMSIAHGEQILLSSASASLLEGELGPGVGLRDLGVHRLKDLSRPETTFQVVSDDLRIDFPALASLDARPNNLPSQISSFIGRERELADLGELLLQYRLITIAGPGGIGKTRTALTLAGTVISRFPQGAWFVGLSSITDPSVIASTVASELGIREIPQEPIMTTVLKELSQSRLLLVLDNSEHLIADSARLVNTLLASCSGVTAVVTARESLHLIGEHVYRLGSMPEVPTGVRFDALLDYDSVRLFIDRASEVRPDFTIGPEDSAAVVSLCHKLDGIPLAIELAAARAGALSLRQLDEHLTSRLRFLVSRNPTIDERQRTLRATIQWSYELLPEIGRRAFAAAAIFEGGFTLEAFERVVAAVCPEPLTMLESLVDASMLVSSIVPGGARYRMLDLIREYASERFAELEVRDTLRQAFVETYAALSPATSGIGSGFDTNAWIEQLEFEIANLRSAIDIAVAGPDVGNLARLCCGAETFWRSHVTEARQILSRVLPHVEDDRAVYVRMLRQAANFATLQDDYTEALRLLDLATAAAGSLIDPINEAEISTAVAMVEQRRGKSDEAMRALQRARELYALAGHDRGALLTTANMAAMKIQTGDLAIAQSLLEEGIRLGQPLEERKVRSFLFGLMGTVAFQQGSLERSSANFATALEELNPQSEGHLWTEMLNSLAVVRAHQGDFDEAGRLVSTSVATSLGLEHRAGIVGSLEAASQLCWLRNMRGEAAEYYRAATELRTQTSYWSRSLIGCDELERNVTPLLSERNAAPPHFSNWREAAEELARAGPHDLGAMEQGI